jgi:hypothetical protein
MSIHEFTLILPVGADIDDATMDALYEAGCGDAVAGKFGGVVRLHFCREAPDRVKAILSAIRDVGRAGFIPVLAWPDP